MIHELIDPKKKTNKSTASRNTRSFLDNKLCSDHLTFDPSDPENKEVDSTATFIPPWLRNSLGLSQRQNQSQLAVGHLEQKSTKIIHRYKDSTQNEFDGLKTNEEEDGSKNINNQFNTLPTHCTQDEDPAVTTVQECTETDLITQSEQHNWQLMKKESDTDSSFPNTEARCFEKIDSKVTNSDLMTFAEIGKIREEEKKKLRFIRQKSKLRRRGTSEQKTFDQTRADTDCTADTKEKNEMNITKKNIHTVPSEIRQLETKFMLLGKCQNSNSPRLNQLELRLLQNMEENVEAIGDYDIMLDHERNINSRDIIKKSEFLTSSITDKKVGDLVLQKLNFDNKPDVDKDSMLSTDDENDIKRFSEFLSKNKNGEEKRKCLEEVRNYFEKKRKTRMSKKRYLEELKKLSPETDRKENHKDKIKSRELTMILPNRGKRSKFALCDEEVVERAVDETLQKFVELYHFHVSPRVMGNMKRNILQAMQSDSLESGGSKMTLEDEKSGGKTVRSNALTAVKPQPSKRDIPCNHPRQIDLPEIIDDETNIYKENKKKIFKTLIVNSDEKLGGNQPEETDVIDNDKLKRLNKEFEVFLRSIQGHLDVSNLKIQSIILEKEEANQSKHVQFVYNFRKKALETEKLNQGGYEEKCGKELGVQANLKKEATKKSVRIQASDCLEKSEQSTQTEEKNFAVECTQTDGSNVTFRELQELQSFEINPGLYRMVKSKEAGKFYLYPEQPDISKGQSYSKSDSSVLKDRKMKKKEFLNMIAKGRNKERRVLHREKERSKLKKNKKISCLGSSLKNGSHREDREGKKKKIESKNDNNDVNNDSSINCLYFRNVEGNDTTSQPFKNDSLSKENSPEAEEKLGVGDVKEEHLGCVWLWNGEKISPGCDLKTHVENLLKEKLREITDFDCVQKNFLMNDLKMEKTETMSSQKNLYVKGLNLSRTNTKVFQEAESQKNFDIKKSNPVFCYTSYSNVNTEKDSRLHLTSENDFTEPTEKADMKKIEEANDVKSSRSISQEKIVRNVATQNSQQKLFSINLAKTKTQSKTTIAVTRRKDGRRTSAIKPLPRKLVNFKKAEEIIRAVEEIKKLEMELKTGRKINSRESDSLPDVSSSSFSSKNEVDEPLSLVLGLREGPSKTEDTSACTVKSRLRKMMNLVSHEVQTNTLSDFEDINSEENKSSCQLPGRHLELIENFLCKVNQKERENLWNDVRQFIKTKIGRDIDDDGAKEVCIEIEQDMPNQESGQTKQAVLARGHYVRNEGDIEVEIDLTLDDLEKILRQRQKRIRRQTQQRKKYKRFISSSSVQSDLNKDEIRKYQKYLNRVAALGQGFTTDIPSGSLKKNKGI